MANKNTMTWQWHRKLGHASFSVLNRLVQFDLIVGLPKIKFTQHEICDACARGKQTRNSFKPKHFVSTSKPFDLVHMDLFGPTRTLSLNGKRFGLVLVDDYSRFLGFSLFFIKMKFLINFCYFSEEFKQFMEQKLQQFKLIMAVSLKTTFLMSSVMNRV